MSIAILDKNKTVDKTIMNRRKFLKSSIAAAAGALIVPAIAAKPAFAAGHKGAHMVAIHNAHTGDSFTGVYRVGDKFLPDSFERINYVLRDFRTGDIFPIDPDLVDLVYAIRQETGRNDYIEILSGYRSPKTNAMLRRTSTGVAKKSFHMSGKAIDIRMPGYSTRNLRKIAVSMKKGGVGYYKSSNFLHVDTGNFRVW